VYKTLFDYAEKIVLFVLNINEWKEIVHELQDLLLTVGDTEVLALRCDGQLVYDL
jgi:hypothetical protein